MPVLLHELLLSLPVLLLSLPVLLLWRGACGLRHLAYEIDWSCRRRIWLCKR